MLHNQALILNVDTQNAATFRFRSIFPAWKIFIKRASQQVSFSQRQQDVIDASNVTYHFRITELLTRGIRDEFHYYSQTCMRSGL